MNHRQAMSFAWPRRSFLELATGSLKMNRRIIPYKPGASPSNSWAPWPWGRCSFSWAPVLVVQHCGIMMMIVPSDQDSQVPGNECTKLRLPPLYKTATPSYAINGCEAGLWLTSNSSSTNLRSCLHECCMHPMHRSLCLDIRRNNDCKCVQL